MPSLFIYNKYVTGKDFIGRKNEATILANLLSANENVTIYDIPKSGKHSLIQQAFLNLNSMGKSFSLAEITLLNVRTTERFIKLFGEAAIRATGSNADDYATAVQKHLSSTHFVFDRSEFNKNGAILSLNWDMDDEDILAIFRLPYTLAAENRQNLHIIIHEFQNILLTEDGDKLLKLFERIIKEMKGRDERYCSFVFSGSMVNAMKEIFEDKRYFYRMVEHIPLGEIEDKIIVEAIFKGFMATGKVADRDLLLGVCRLFRCNTWYINQFISICDSLSKGYIMETILTEALSMILSIHEPKFKAMMNDLTTYQASLLKAILDGHNKFSTSEVINHYGLNSSANVRRLKDALCKKEIITFNEKDEPVILDPLFDYWVRKYYFNMKEI